MLSSKVGMKDLRTLEKADGDLSMNMMSRVQARHVLRDSWPGIIRASRRGSLNPATTYPPTLGEEYITTWNFVKVLETAKHEHACFPVGTRHIDMVPELPIRFRQLAETGPSSPVSHAT